MGIPQLNSCCCGCSLEKGSLIIAWLNIIGGIISVIFFTVALIMGEKARSQGQPTFPLVETSVASIVYVIIVTILSIFLLIGINTKRLSYVLTWVYTMTVVLCLNVIYMIVLLVQVGLPALGTIISILLGAYFVLVVYSYYRQEKGTVGNV